MTRFLRTLALLLSSSSLTGTALSAVIPPRDEFPRDDASLPRAAIALKLGAGALQTRGSVTGAQLVEQLVREAQAGSQNAKRDADFIVSPLITTPPEKLAAMIEQAVKNNPAYQPADFSAWYQVKFPHSAEQETSAEETAELLKTLGKNKEVATCQQLASYRPPTVTPNDDPHYTDQGYLHAAPTGINAAYAWGFPGGDGEGTHIIDVELGWKLDHEDLAAANITLLAGGNTNDHAGFSWPHGTAVLGEMFMVDNQIGGVGIVPAANGDGVGVQRTENGGPSTNQPQAILDAASFLGFGDVMLLEMQVADADDVAWPVEILDAEFEAIQLATSMGITVIEPAANGGVSLDGSVVRYGEETPHSFLNPQSSEYRESGAIMVGAGTPAYPRTRESFSNYGSRVDVHAWGRGIFTTSVNLTGGFFDTYTEFDGTSGASPIITGAAASIQGMVYKNRGRKLSPAEMKELIKIGGTPTTNPSEDQIGVMPDLKALIDGGYLN